MRRVASILLFSAAFGVDAIPAEPAPKNPGPNPRIDIEGYLKIAREAAKHRETRRLSEEDFIKMSVEAGVVILDARGKAMFDLQHIKGAINLNFSDIAVERLKQTLSDKDARILIYCNNNFPNSVVFQSKLPTASLNISTYIALYNYCYRSVYELGPKVDPKMSKLTFESTLKSR